MSRKFIAVITAAAVTLTAFGHTAQAGERNRNTERAIAALLGAVIVGKILHDKNTREEPAVTRTRPRDDIYRPHRVEPRVVPRVQPRVEPRVGSRLHPRPLPRRVNKRLLPRECFRSFDTRRGKQRGFGQRCLNNNYKFSNSLPQQCLIRMRTDRGPRRAYEARCLRDQGYRLARG